MSPMTRADRTDLAALAARLRDLAARARRLPPPNHRRPDAFHEARSELGADIERLARQLSAPRTLSDRT
jgi:predicted Zn-dependent protease